MCRLSFFLLFVALVLGGCSDDSEPTDSQPDAGSPTLTEELTAAGLPPGNWRVEHGGNSVCIRTFTAPGNITTTEAVGMSGFSTFQLRVDGEGVVTLRGTSDEIEARWTDARCLEHEAGRDAVRHHERCDDEERGCPPFSVVRLCANDGSPTFFALVPDCGHRTFPAVAQ
jgi:hypothetical protein